MILKVITIKGQYTGRERRGIMVGGIPFLPMLPPKVANVDEKTFKFLKDGERSGWFNITEDNYARFLSSRGIEVEAGVETEDEAEQTGEDTSLKAIKDGEKVEDEKVEDEKVEDEKVEVKKGQKKAAAK